MALIRSATSGVPDMGYAFPLQAAYLLILIATPGSQPHHFFSILQTRKQRLQELKQLAHGTEPGRTLCASPSLRLGKLSPRGPGQGASSRIQAAKGPSGA